ncbi:6707_t:CDS:2 [Acaulospora morrowiae]|uniref:6707_t:CDS:1 n=1 Tax=Acaulospora morrowiae TaxID=94023 RepID=A0A9N9DK17_9GLOM|nr:6707_t:CDS:2 [Acaulospora morrowiae]
MVSLGSFFIIYLLGGVTFIPIVILLNLLIIRRPWTSKKVEEIKFDDVSQEIKDSSLENDKSPEDDSNFYKVGWLRVTKEHETSTATQNGSTFGNIVKSFMEGKNAQVKRPKDSFFAVLKYNTLFMYDSERQLDCKGIIIVSNHDVSMYPEHLPDNEIFLKNTSIRLKKKMSICADMAIEAESSNYYLFCSVGVDKEDWYFALQKSSKLEFHSPGPQPQVVKDKAQFDQYTMNHLLKTLYSSDDHIQTQWLNVILGRIFLSVYKTQVVKDYFIRKLVKKVKKVKKPNFLSDILIKSVEVGDGVPYITNPRLVDLNANGELNVELNLDYSGGFRVEIETEATISVTRLKPIKFPLVLAVVLRGLQGKMLLRIKAPPTNRIWLGFYEMPKLDLLIEPIVSETQLKFSLITNAIESKIHEMIMDSLVLPNMDDTPFFVSFGKGGVFEEPESQGDEVETVPPVSVKPEEDEEEKSDNQVNKTAVEEEPDNTSPSSAKPEPDSSTSWRPTKSRINRTLTTLHESLSDPNLLRSNSKLRSLSKHFKSRNDDSSRVNGTTLTTSGSSEEITDEPLSSDTLIPASQPTSTLKKWGQAVSIRRRTSSMGIKGILNHNHNESDIQKVPSNSIDAINSTAITSAAIDVSKRNSAPVLSDSSFLSPEQVAPTPTPPPSPPKSPKDLPELISSSDPSNEIDATTTKYTSSSQSLPSSFKFNTGDHSPTTDDAIKLSSALRYDDENDGSFNKVVSIINAPVEELNQVLG